MSVLTEEASAVGSTIHISTKKAPSMADLAAQLEQVEKIGNWIFRSKFFGCEYPEQASIIAAECYLTQQTPLEYLKRNKIVAGKPFQQYDSMLAGFNGRGGKHKILKNDSDGASVEFSYQGVTETRTLLWEDAKRESFPYLGKEGEIVDMLAAGKEPKLKPKYATPRSRATMLFARLVSSSLRTICPEVNFGTYTEEEINDFVDAESVRVVQPEVNEVEQAERAKRIAAKTKKVEPEKVEPVQAVEEVNPVEQAEPETKPVLTEEPVQLMASEDGGGQCSVTDPISETQVQEVKRLMAEIYAAGQLDIKDRIKAKILDSGMSKLTDLNQAEAALLITALGARNVQLWIDSSLAGTKSPN